MPEEKFIMPHSFRLWLLDSISLDLGGQNIMMESAWWSKATHLVAAQKQRWGEGVLETHYSPFKGTSLMNSLPPVSFLPSPKVSITSH
jgi:hypothetical protein